MKARYEGKCPICKRPIEVGDEIEYDEIHEMFVHEDCAEGAEPTDTQWRDRR